MLTAILPMSEALTAAQARTGMAALFMHGTGKQNDACFSLSFALLW